MNTPTEEGLGKNRIWGSCSKRQSRAPQVPVSDSWRAHRAPRCGRRPRPIGAHQHFIPTPASAQTSRLLTIARHPCRPPPPPRPRLALDTSTPRRHPPHPKPHRPPRSVTPTRPDPSPGRKIVARSTGSRLGSDRSTVRYDNRSPRRNRRPRGPEASILRS